MAGRTQLHQPPTEGHDQGPEHGSKPDDDAASRLWATRIDKRAEEWRQWAIQADLLEQSALA